ncbi:MAG: sensor histidine kinase [Vallitaleaceae bacterium]|nr:sensor histidine kinase [Vallitaleaceae bacterium]
MNHIWEVISNKMSKLSMFLKITILFEAVMIISILFVASFITTNFSSIVKEKEIALGDTKVEKIAGFVQGKYERIYSLSNYMHSGKITEILASVVRDYDQGYKIENINYTKVFFAGVNSADGDISDVILISKNGLVYTRTAEGYSEVKPSFDFVETPMVQTLLKSDEDIQTIYMDPTMYTLKKREPVISFIGKIFDSKLFPKRELVGIYIMNVPLSKVKESFLLEDGNSKGEITLINKQEQVLFSTNSVLQGKAFPFRKIENNKSISVNTKGIGTSGMKVIYILPNQVLLEEINVMKGKIFLVLVIAILITLLWSLFVFQLFNKRVKVLIKSMRKVQKGDFSLHIPVNSQDEIGILSQSFNEMCEKLNHYISQVYTAEIKRKNAELNALQTQIDPHFLYNTLESVKAKALEENDEITAEMISLLGNLFRWSSKTNDKIILLDDEIDYISTYLELQCYRFNELLDVDIQIPEELLDLGIPKLILQPIVENVMKHALVCGEKPGLVGIIGKHKQNNLEITIYDNGKGMSENQLKQVRDKLDRDVSQDDFESIGIQNVHHRLRLLFGEPYGLQIESSEGRGTAVKVVIPALSKEEMSKIV